MNILYCGNQNIEDGLFISILSLLKNINERLNIFVLTIELKNENYEIKGVRNSTIDFLDKRVKINNPDNFVKKIDVTNIFKQELPIANMDTRFTPCCMLRLYADLIAELPDRILYLDNDVVCRQNCASFYNQEIDNYEIIGTLDYYGKWFFKKNLFKFDYINSGVLLLNLNKIRETKLFQKCRNLCKNKKMFMPDQSAINKLAKNKKIMDRKYNEQRKLQNDTVLQHFTTSFRLFPLLHTVTVKPWHVDKIHKVLKIFEYDDILNEYINKINQISK